MINIREIIRRIIKYSLLILIVGFACYSIPSKKIDNNDIIWIALVAGMVFTILDTVTPSIKIYVSNQQ